MTETVPREDWQVRVERPNAGVAVVTLDRPESLNALDPELADQLHAVLVDLRDDSALSVVILTGAGRGFCSGADLRALAQRTHESQAQTPLEHMQRSVRPRIALAELPQLTIAAVNGAAIGAGFGLAMGCDLRIAGPAARFGATFVRLGLGPDYGLAQTLPQAVGRERAVELLASGRMVDAEEALRLGMVLSVDHDPLAAAIELGRTIAAAPRRATLSVKNTVALSANASIQQVIEVHECYAQAELFEHPDFLVDAAAWLTKHGGATAQP